MEAVANALGIAWRRFSYTQPLGVFVAATPADVASLALWGTLLLVYALAGHTLLLKALPRVTLLLSRRADLLALTTAAAWAASYTPTPAPHDAATNQRVQQALLSEFNSRRMLAILAASKPPAAGDPTLVSPEACLRSAAAAALPVLLALTPIALRLRLSTPSPEALPTPTPTCRIASFACLYMAPVVLLWPIESNLLRAALFYCGVSAFLAASCLGPTPAGIERHARDPRVEALPGRGGRNTPGRSHGGVERFSHYNLLTGLPVGAGNTTAELLALLAGLPWMVMWASVQTDSIQRRYFTAGGAGAIIREVRSGGWLHALVLGGQVPAVGAPPGVGGVGGVVYARHAVPRGVLRMFGRSELPQQQQQGLGGVVGVGGIPPAALLQGALGCAAVALEFALWGAVLWCLVYAVVRVVLSLACAASNTTWHERAVYREVARSVSAEEAGRGLAGEPGTAALRLPVFASVPLGIRLGVPKHGKGVTVAGVTPGSPAAAAGVGKFVSQRFKSAGGRPVQSV